MEPLTSLLSIAPQFALAGFLFWMCSQNADKQRTAYQEQIKQLYALIEKALDAAGPLIEAVQRESVSK